MFDSSVFQNWMISQDWDCFLLCGFYKSESRNFSKIILKLRLYWKNSKFGHSISCRKLESLKKSCAAAYSLISVKTLVSSFSLVSLQIYSLEDILDIIPYE